MNIETLEALRALCSLFGFELAKDNYGQYIVYTGLMDNKAKPGSLMAFDGEDHGGD